jgi:ectoine hydroxylase-related dioxygenase (phytanoyl-CoA dioxygenase family)
VVDSFVSALESDGSCVVRGAIDAGQVVAARTDLVALLEQTPVGRDDFEGRRTKRVYGLFAKTRALDALSIHPVVLDLLDRVLGNYQLSAPAAVSIGPGEHAQPLHPDDSIYPLPRPHPELVVSVMWPLVDFTEENGATQIVPGSHRFTEERPGPGTECVHAKLAAGDALVYLGSLWHGGGANRSAEPRLGVVLHYAVGWLRPVENHVLVVPPDDARHLPERLQELLGYDISPPFIGYVDGRHPRKLLQAASS